MAKRYNAHMTETGKFMSELKRIGISDAKAAEISGLDRVAVWRLGKGKQKTITLDDAVRLARELGLSIDEICGISSQVANSA